MTTLPSFRRSLISTVIMSMGVAGVAAATSASAAVAASADRARPPLGATQHAAPQASENIAVMRAAPATRPGRLIVKFKSASAHSIVLGADAKIGSAEQKGAAIAAALSTEARSALAAVRGSIVRGSARTGLAVVKTPLKVGQAIESLYRSGTIDYAQPDYRYRIAATTPNDTMFNEQWALNNTGQPFFSSQVSGKNDADVDGPEAWDTATSADDTIIGVVDTGIAYDHEDLADNMWSNPGEIPGNGIDDDGNGYVDDVHGINGDFSEYSSIDPYDDNGHGTHVSGIADASGNNGKGIAGVAWKGKLMALKFLDTYGYGYTSDAITVIDYALDIKQRYGYKHMVLNASWGGGGFDQGLYDTLAAARDAGVLFFAAAGNDGANLDSSTFYPAGYDLPNIVTVGATDYNDQPASFSNFGCGSVDLFAPGVDILSSVPYDYYNGPYDFYSGTSMATPMVTGSAALVWSQYPNADWTQIKNALLNSVDPLDSLRREAVTQGRLNLKTALVGANQTVPTVWSVTPASAIPGDSITISGNGFGATAGSVSINGTALAVGSWSDSQITAALPSSAGLGAGKVMVKTSTNHSSVAGGCLRVGYHETLVGNTLLPHTRNASAQINNSVWLFGGYAYDQTGLVEKYDLSTGSSSVNSKWTMPVATTDMYAAVSGSKVYVPGGYDLISSQAINTFQIFDTATGKWTLGPSLPAPRWGAATAASGGKVYVFGGGDTDTGNVFTNTFIYDPKKKTWSQGAAMPVGLVFASTTTMDNGRIRIYGGFTSQYYGSETASVLEYKPSSNSWTTLPDMPTARGGAALAKSSTVLGILHGTDVGATTDDLQNLSTGNWLVDPVDGSSLFLATGAVRKNNGYVFNGESPNPNQGIYQLPLLTH